MADYINNNAGMDWDDAIENDGQEFIILPEGDYNFTVTDSERGRFPGSAKMSACNKATLTLQVKTDDGIASVRTDRDGNERQANDVDRFYDYDEKFFPAEDDWMEITGDEDLPFN